MIEGRVYWYTPQEKMPEEGADVLYMYCGRSPIVSGYFDEGLFKTVDDDGNEIDILEPKWVAYWAYTWPLYPPERQFLNGI